MMAGYNEETSVRQIAGVGPAAQLSLERSALLTVHNVLDNIPRRYLDAQNPQLISQLLAGEMAVVQGTVISAKTLHLPGKRGAVIATVQDATGQLKVRWFNQPYIQRRLLLGSTWVLIGLVRQVGSKLEMLNPALETDQAIFPLYRPVSGISSKVFRKYAAWCLDHSSLDPRYELPAEIRAQQTLPLRADFLKAAHQPHSNEDIFLAQRYAQFAELFWFFAAQAIGQNGQTPENAPPIPHTPEQLRQLVGRLPFQLTEAQRQGFWQIVRDMGTRRPMVRLLNGDVGSGKTAVAALAAALVKEAGLRSVFLVPTEVLAHQHAVSIGRLLGPGFTIAIWTANQKDDALSADITIGTHALLYQGFPKERIGLVIVDEQHRFGVRQRHQLISASGLTPHFLTMTATPIPRTLALALFSDLKMSVLDERPANRAPIVTQIVSNRSSKIVDQRIASELALGHQVLIICPLINEDTEIEAPAAHSEAKKIEKEHPEYGEIGLLHGELPSAKKRSVMERMASLELQVLVSTTVIEVGIDLPNATVMVIKGAERFGLSQLHQLRGRIGRSGLPSYCFLWPSSGQPARLEKVVASQDGFEIARADLEERGPGSLAGTLQSGIPDFERTALNNLELLAEVKESAYAYCAEHPDYNPGEYSYEQVGWE